ncbi:MAG: tetratricopeptide repeat protein [Cyanobacteria bacterium P01_D01_bin.105]
MAATQDSHPQDATTHSALTYSALQAGATAFSEGKYNEALQYFTQSIESSPAAGYGNRCLVQLQMQNYVAAIEDCTQSLVIKEDSEVRLNLGLAYERSGEHMQAITQYEKIIAANLADYRTHYNLALSKAAIGSHQDAVEAYTLALHALPTAIQPLEQAEIYRDRGASHLVLTNYMAAVTDLNAAISHNPHDTWAYFNRGCAYHRNNNFLPALQDFSWVIEHDHQNARAYFNRGIIYARLHQSEAAIENLTQAIEHFPKDSPPEEVRVSIAQAHQLIAHLQVYQVSEQPVFSWPFSLTLEVT